MEGQGGASGHEWSDHRSIEKKYILFLVTPPHASGLLRRSALGRISAVLLHRALKQIDVAIHNWRYQLLRETPETSKYRVVSKYGAVSIEKAQATPRHTSVKPRKQLSPPEAAPSSLINFEETESHPDDVDSAGPNVAEGAIRREGACIGCARACDQAMCAFQ